MWKVMKMAETSPYQEEKELEDSIEEALFTLFLLAVISSQKKFTGQTFTNSLVDAAQQTFEKELSKIIPTLSQKGVDAIQVGIDRTLSTTDLKDLTYNFNSPRFQETIRRIFDDQMIYLTETNARAVQRLLEIASERGWTDAQVLARLRKYFGLVPDHINTVVKLEDALVREGAAKKVVDKTVQKKIDNLLEWRATLTATQVATEVVERSKAVAFAEMFEDGDIPDDYVKQAIAVLDDRTTQICTSSHLTTAELNGNFPNGFFSPPFNNPLHPCRTTIRIIKRPSNQLT